MHFLVFQIDFLCYFPTRTCVLYTKIPISWLETVYRTILTCLKFWGDELLDELKTRIDEFLYSKTEDWHGHIWAIARNICFVPLASCQEQVIMGGCSINGQKRTFTQNRTENISVTSKPIAKVFSYDVCPMLGSENFDMKIVRRWS